jgi:hypothetical protein
MTPGAPVRDGPRRPRLRGRALIPVCAAAGLLWPAPSGAETRARQRVPVVRRTCFDGTPAPCEGACPQASCDTDAACNGVCSFAFLTCGTVGCVEHFVGVPVKHRKKMFFVPSMGAQPMKFVLRCRPHRRRLACPTTTTSPPP